MREKGTRQHGRDWFPKGFCESEDDLAQDLYVCLIEAWPRYDPEKGGILAFAYSVLNKKSAKILCKYCRQKRPNNTLRIELSSFDVADDRVDDCAVVFDVQKKLRKMPDNVRQVLEQLKTKTTYRVAKDMGISRFKLNKLIKDSRLYFHDLSNSFNLLTTEFFYEYTIKFFR
ncbi:MAG: hypothetical protein LBS14_04045 [Holosporaceae bacterium]|nr:hypothetical protein [Holosporaceae bacterium]